MQNHHETTDPAAQLRQLRLVPLEIADLGSLHAQGSNPRPDLYPFTTGRVTIALGTGEQCDRAFVTFVHSVGVEDEHDVRRAELAIWLKALFDQAVAEGLYESENAGGQPLGGPRPG
ncbi:MAG: hypothetical protein ABIW82_17010 [Dokdonella sp.]